MPYLIRHEEVEVDARDKLGMEVAGRQHWRGLPLRFTNEEASQQDIIELGSTITMTIAWFDVRGYNAQDKRRAGGRG